MPNPSSQTIPSPIARGGDDEADYAIDPRNLSQDSDVDGHAYFLRPFLPDGGDGDNDNDNDYAFGSLPATEEEDECDDKRNHQNLACMMTDDLLQMDPTAPQMRWNSEDFGAFLNRPALTPPRVLSSNSLYGENLINSVIPALSRTLERLPVDDEEEGENIMTFSPSPRLGTSPDDDYNSPVTTTPPSVQYPLSLSPPPPPASVGSSPQLPLRYQNNLRGDASPTFSPSTYNNNGSNFALRSTTKSVNSQASLHNNHTPKKKNRPPRAPNVTLRFLGSSSAIPAALLPPHKRDPSTGDASFMSALTDSDYGYGDAGGGGGGISGISSVPVSLSSLAAAAHASAGSLQSYEGVSSTTHDSVTTTTLPLQQPLPPHRDTLARDNRISRAPVTSLSSLWGPHMVGDDDAVRGMNIDIPNSLQQPILGDDDDDDGIGVLQDCQQDIDIDEHDQDQNVGVGRLNLEKHEGVADYGFPNDVTGNISSVVEASSVKLDNERGDDDSNQAFWATAHGGHLDQLHEFETEAERLVLKALEDQLNAVPPEEEYKQALFPTISDEGAEHLKRTRRPSSASNKSSSLSISTMHWQALQVAVGDGTCWSRVVATTLEDSKDFSTPLEDCKDAGAGDLLLDNAQVILADYHKGSLRKRHRKQKGYSEARIKGFADTAPQRSVPIGGDKMNKADDRKTNNAEKRRSTNILSYIFDPVFLLSRHLKIKYDQSLYEIRANWATFEVFLGLQKESLCSFMKYLLVFLILPSLVLASVLFYVVESPSRTLYTTTMPLPPGPSHSWWILFAGCRVPVVFSLARGLAFFLSNYLGVYNRRFVKIVGSRMALIVAQSQGWPCILFCYGCLSFLFLTGNDDFSRHWLFWQDYIKMCNKNNPAGDVTSRDPFQRFTLLCILLGVAITMKRYWMSYHLARRLYYRYGGSVRSLADKLTLFAESSSLALVRRQQCDATMLISPAPSRDNDNEPEDAFDILPHLLRPVHHESFRSSPMETKNVSLKNCLKGMGQSEALDGFSYLDEWDEPSDVKKSECENASLQDILEFRQAILQLNTAYPFSAAFGPADSRKKCFASASKLYYELLSRQSEKNFLDFRTLCEIAINPDGSIDSMKLKRLVQLLKPNKENAISAVCFTRSVDKVYRELKTLAARIRNASAIDRVYESLLNVAFYICLIFSSFHYVGFFNAISFALTIVSIAVLFSFVIGSACCLVFEGVLMILFRRPYDIGDYISVVDIDMDRNPTGRSRGIVEDISLLYTTIRSDMTREVATVSNGAIARCRIINASRSGGAPLMIHVKLGLDVPLSKIELFKSAVRKFIEERPQELYRTVGFRLTRVEVDLEFVEYVVVVQSRSSRAETNAALESKRMVASFCLEVQKKLNIRYTSPP